MLMLMGVQSLRNEVDSIEDHFLRTYYPIGSSSLLGTQRDSIRTLEDELLANRHEIEIYNRLTDKRVEELGVLHSQISTELEQTFDSYEDFMGASLQQSAIEEELYTEEISRKRHLTQIFSNSFEFFEGTLRLCSLYYKEVHGSVYKAGSDGYEEFRNLLTEQRDFPKNNDSWKRINGIYAHIHDAIKHNESRLPEVKLGRKAVLNFHEKWSKKQGESLLEGNHMNQIRITQGLTEHLIDDILSFSQIPSVAKYLTQFYQDKGAQEIPTTIDCYRSFSDMYNRVETTLVKLASYYDRTHETTKPISEIKKTGMARFIAYAESNGMFEPVIEDPSFQKLNGFYKMLQNSIKHNKGNIIAIDEENRQELSDYIAKENTRGDYTYYDIKQNTLTMHPAAIECFSEDIGYLLQTVEQYIRETV